MRGHVIWKVDETHGVRWWWWWWWGRGTGVDNRAPLEQGGFSLSACGNILEGTDTKQQCPKETSGAVGGISRDFLFYNFDIYTLMVFKKSVLLLYH